MKNENIIILYENLKKAFDDNTKYFPAKINFIIHKNINLLKSFSEEIYRERDAIIQHYGDIIDNVAETYQIPEQFKKIAQQELDELLEIEQNINILYIKLNQIENLEFTSNQMEAIMFMIEEENDEDQVE